MLYREFDPAAALATHVARYWGMAVPGVPGRPGPFRVLPDGCPALIATRRGDATHLTLQGPHESPIMVPVRPGDRFWGVRFRPDAGAAVFGVPAASLVGVLRPAAEIFGASATALARALGDAVAPEAARRLLDAWLAPRIVAAPVPDPVVRVALLAIIAGNGGPPVGALARLVGIGPRQLQRRFRRATGLTLKRFARIRRLRASLTHLVGRTPRTWGQVAADLGFADQAHLGREFVRLTGLTPTEVAEQLADIHHVNVQP
jgi:AraC-like DNA-binding protein